MPSDSAAAGGRPSKLGAIVSCRCPRCRTGKMFASGPYDLKRFSKMHEHCPHCGLRFEVEPGFFWGAMYIGYAVNVGLIVAGLVSYFLFFNSLPEFAFLGIIVGLIVGLLPLNFRYGRVLMLHWFSPVKFDVRYWRGE